MNYIFIVRCPELKTIEKVRELLLKSKVYNSQEIMSLGSIKEICDECFERKS